MTFQYALRFESGERRGEVIPLTIVTAQGGVFTIGRQPGNSLQVTDASVSGRHAELESSPDGLSIRDLDSTNGTEVRGRRVRQCALDLNDEFVLGKVQFRLVDASTPSDSLGLELEMEPPPDVVGLSQTQIQPRDESFEITAEDIARSGRTSKLAPIGLLALAGLAAGAWFWSRSGSTVSDGSSLAVEVSAVNEPAGNLLSAGYSFETADGWVSIDGDGDRFDLVGSAASTGRRGARAELLAGEYAQLVSDPVAATGAHKVVASLLLDGDVSARLGVQWSVPRTALANGEGGDSDPRNMTLWSDWIQAAGSHPEPGFETLEFPFTVPPGADAVSVVLWAQSNGAAAAGDGADGESLPNDLGDYAIVDVDDVAMVPDGQATPMLSEASWRVLSIARSVRAPGQHRAIGVSSLTDPMIHGIQVRGSEAENGIRDFVPFRASAEGSDVLIEASASGALEFRVAAPMVQAGLATISGGTESGREPTYASHGTVFDAPGARVLLLGSDAKLVTVTFPTLREVSGRPQIDGAVVRVGVSAGETLRLQFNFSEARTQAQLLVRQAREVRSRGASGEALRIYDRLLKELPFDQKLVLEAGRALDEITAVGRQELKELAVEVERARFFGLGDLYREKLTRVAALQLRYKGSAIEPACLELAAQIEAELNGLGFDAAKEEAKRLEAVASALRAQGSDGLAARVEQYMTKTNAKEPMASGSNGGDR